MSRLQPLAGDQDRASQPRVHAALSASAGTGKTHVLTARVLRLLLAGADPSAILCLTFTKAGAAEMADRLHARLAHWVRLKDADLRKELFALGERNDPDMLVTARTLFARVLDARGGGLRIQTIHAFAQALLAAFPVEAGLVPGFRPMEGREEQLLARATLAEMLVRAEGEGDHSLVADLQALSHRLGEGGAESFLKACARAPVSMAELGPRQGIEPMLRRAFGLPSGDIEQAIADACGDDAAGDGAFDHAALRAIDEANRLWGTPSGLKCCEAIAAWRQGEAGGRALSLDAIAAIVLKKDGEPRSVTAGLARAAPDYADHAARLVECCRRLLRLRSTARLVTCFAAGLRAGQAFASAYTAAKSAQGLADFDDLIRWAEKLLTTDGMGDWVRFKLDQATDHILVDEAQDTNASQWAIVGALMEEYFAGEGAAQRPRTIFTVGDFKQAIFGFQGTDPREFDRARRHFEQLAQAAREGAIALEFPPSRIPPEFLNLSMDLSFRSSPPVLTAVDRVIADLGHGALGLPDRPNPHLSHHSARPGSVVLWPPFTADSGEEEEDAGEEGWIAETSRRYATCLARRIRRWLEQPFEIEDSDGRRPLRPEDILILVRRRGDLASLIVARLHAERVPVAGVDRLSLSAPLAVQDLLAAARFAMQPLDDLNLAALLVSPLFGWTQDALFALGHGRSGSLWARMAEPHPDLPQLADTREGLLSLLAKADYAPPSLFFETILSGPLEGRRRLLERLGPEARDPIEELLAGALEFEASSGPSLQRFLDWFARGEVEIVRDPSGPRDAVRVMTVHGAKGLQAPVVILADAGADPSRKGGFGPQIDSYRLADGLPSIPLFRPKKDELVDPMRAQAEAQDAREREEHWRLLYVAMTRAEQRLYVGAALGPADRNGPPQQSWYAAIQRSLGELGAAAETDPVWGEGLRLGDGEASAAAAQKRKERPVSLPEWLRQDAPQEARPPRPLVPSAPGEDEAAYPPPGPAQRAAADRGKWLHALFERLPAVPAAERAERASQWLERSAGVSDEGLRAALVADACAIIGDSLYADLFGPDALAEAPIAALVEEGAVVSGTVDRLLVTEDRVLVADFKTGRKVPGELEEIPAGHVRQMAAYAAALRAIFPGRRVEAALLYTSGPTLHMLPESLLERAGG